jgi:hypothetical protein
MGTVNSFAKGGWADTLNFPGKKKGMRSTQ